MSWFVESLTSLAALKAIAFLLVQQCSGTAAVYGTIKNAMPFSLALSLSPFFEILRNKANSLWNLLQFVFCGIQESYFKMQ